MPIYNVLLIDDEPIILQGLCLLIDWEASGFQIVGCASDGIEGLDMIRKLQPDIVISDINMPNISGIEMISQALSVCSCRFIILSGYSDFTYARQCISLGVEEYLLKPVAEEELLQSLHKVAKQITADKKAALTVSELNTATHLLHILSTDDVMRDISNSFFETENDFFNTLTDYDINFKRGGSYVSIAFKFSQSASLPEFRAVLQEKLNCQFSSFLLFYIGNSVFMCMLSFETVCSSNTLYQQSSSLLDQLEPIVQTDLCIGIGNIYDSANQLPVSAKQALNALSYNIIRGFTSVNSYNSNLQNAYFTQSIPSQLWNNYQNSLANKKYAAVSAAIHKIFQYMTQHSEMPLLGIQINSLYLLITCLNHRNAESDFSSVPDNDNVDYMQQISSIQTASELESYVLHMISHIMNTGEDSSFVKANDLITRVINYISANYLEDVSLISVSQIFFVSPIYLSQAFKKHTGQLYLDYVTQIKIEAAKKMLLTTDLMVYEISDLLHYKDSKYFSRLFEKKTGKKPSEYRRHPIK